MELNYYLTESGLVLCLSGELDECTAARIRTRLDDIITCHLTAKRVVFDLSGLRFMDSTGVGVILGRYKKYAKFLPFFIANPSPAAHRVLGIGGIYDIMPLCG